MDNVMYIIIKNFVYNVIIIILILIIYVKIVNKDI